MSGKFVGSVSAVRKYRGPPLEAETRLLQTTTRKLCRRPPRDVHLDLRQAAVRSTNQDRASDFPLGLQSGTQTD